MRTVLEVAADEREDNNVPVLSREFEAHVEMVLKEFVVKAIKTKQMNEKA